MSFPQVGGILCYRLPQKTKQVRLVSLQQRIDKLSVIPRNWKARKEDSLCNTENSPLENDSLKQFIEKITAGAAKAEKPTKGEMKVVVDGTLV